MKLRSVCGARAAVTLVAVVAATSAVSQASPAAAAARASSVTLGLDLNFADPSFVEADGAYYAFSTGNGFPVASAPNIRGPWTMHGKSMAARPTWTKQPETGTRDWAPDVFRRESDGTFIMYYTALDKAGNRQCIGVATSPSPLGPFTDPEDHARVCPPSGLTRSRPVSVHQAGRYALDHLHRWHRADPRHPDDRRPDPQCRRRADHPALP